MLQVQPSDSDLWPKWSLPEDFWKSGNTEWWPIRKIPNRIQETYNNDNIWENKRCREAITGSSTTRGAYAPIHWDSSMSATKKTTGSRSLFFSDASHPLIILWALSLTRTRPWQGLTSGRGWIFPVQVFQSDGTFVAKFGSMGSKPGQLEHPHYIAVSNTNRVIVSDSNNHRLQVKLEICFKTWFLFSRSLTWTAKYWPPLDQKEQKKDNSSSPGPYQPILFGNIYYS